MLKINANGNNQRQKQKVIDIVNYACLFDGDFWFKTCAI